MFALLPLLLTLVPDVVGLFTGPKTEAHVSAVTDAVKAITGTEDPEKAAAVLAADDQKTAELRVALAKIAADSAAADRQAEIEDFKASLADVSSARQQTVDLAKSGSSAGSARKTELLQASSVAAPAQPTSVLGAVAAGVEATADDLNAQSLSKARGN